MGWLLRYCISVSGRLNSSSGLCSNSHRTHSQIIRNNNGSAKFASLLFVLFKADLCFKKQSKCCSLICFEMVLVDAYRPHFNISFTVCTPIPDGTIIYSATYNEYSLILSICMSADHTKTEIDLYCSLAHRAQWPGVMVPFAEKHTVFVFFFFWFFHS